MDLYKTPSKPSMVGWLILASILLSLTLGCSIPSTGPQTTLTPEIIEQGVYGKSRKYLKNGLSVVYLRGAPYEIGLAHGKLCKKEIEELNASFFNLYDRFAEDPHNKWIELSGQLGKNIPKEYIDEMRGISDGSNIEYNKILFINTLSTISMKDSCLAFAFQNANSEIITLRQDDEFKNTDFHRKMVLFIIKPDEGIGFAAIITPGWVDGETGINEKGITVSQNNIGIKQKKWDVMPITVLSRYMLQYSETINDADRLLDEQQTYPGRLIFVSSRNGASVFEFVNTEKARINMKNGFLALSNHARVIPSRRSGGSSVKRLSILEEFLTQNGDKMSIEKAIEFVRTPYLSRDNFWDRLRVHNRQAYIFSPGTLNFWIALPPSDIKKPACYGPYIGFNLMQELYGSGQIPSPKYFSARQ
jgi:predicted choloylglycine hydrolase